MREDYYVHDMSIKFSKIHYSQSVKLFKVSESERHDSVRLSKEPSSCEQIHLEMPADDEREARIPYRNIRIL